MDRRQFIGSGAAAASLAILPAGIARAATVARAPAGPGDVGLKAAFDAIFDAQMDRSPEFATSLGLDKGANAARKRRLGDRSRVGLETELTATRKSIATLEAIDPRTLGEAAKLDREVVLYGLRQRTVGPAQFGVGSPIRPFTITQQGGSYFSVPDFLNSTHTVASADDAEAYLARLDAFAVALDQDSAVQAEEAGKGLLAPSFSLDLALQQMAKLRAAAPAYAGLVTSLTGRATKAGLTGDYGPRASKIVADKVYPALDRQIALVKKLREKATADAGLWRVPRGDEMYAAALRASTTTDVTPDEVHKMGLAQVAEISAGLDAILKSQGMTQGSIGERLTKLNASPAQLYPDTPAGRTELIARLNADVRAMQAKLPAMFLNPPTAPLEIRAVPVEIQDGASNGYYHTASLDGTRPAIYFINLKDVGDWPKYGLPALTYHEGLPGHHLQISIALGTDAPMLRKTSFFGAYIEGWALYAEQLADELGAYGPDPLDRAGYLQSFLFRAARLVVDSGIHAKKWTREQATDYLVTTTGFARPRAQREVERYCTMPGQATSYKVGHMSWVKARARAKAIAGPRFDLKKFHEVLREGALPLTILEQLVEQRAKGWVV
ncbi:DUF885 family protein [Sphingomonas naphthae]|uniref:DUF885 family protein n=1 Tax=Sphingomonas naphthae TaxID=1813468 RepID=A0ABY7TSS1_9SPHN|nr:DUF885 family protein [Sphingomonas naphthae]WCT74919.1 DUF885 family protein [Sphingomonas naphthae]